MANIRIGNGFDVHSFVSGKDLVLGGTVIQYPYGLEGHSDADVLTHAIIDSLLGAAGMPDIGQLYPDNDESYRGILSIKLLEDVGERMRQAGIIIINIDSIVVCQEPKIYPHVERMKQMISRALKGLGTDRIGIKGKTTEGLGFTGRGEGIAVYAVALVQYPDED